MSGLWERWHELSRRGGLDVAGCQMLGDWKKEADGLRRELQTANQAVEKMRGRLQQAEGREARYRIALEEIVSVGKDCGDITGSQKAYYRKKIAKRVLSSPSQPSKTALDAEGEK